MPSGDVPAPGSLASLAALGKLLDEHRPKLLLMVQRRIDPRLAVRLDPDVILQDAYLRARGRWDAYVAMPDRADGYVWLYGIVRDCLIDAWRHENAQIRSMERELPWPERSSIQLGMGLLGTATSPSAGLVRRELQMQVQQTLALLKHKDKEILWMRHYDQLSFAEAAQVLGITENAANVRYFRALQRLKELWEKLHPASNDQ